MLGLDPFNREKLESIRPPGEYRFHGLLDRSQVSGASSFDFKALLQQAEQGLESFQGPVDAILNFWDFPASGIHSILCERHGLPGPSLDAVVKCDHKYWSRLEQEKSVPEVVPSYHVFDPFEHDSLDDIPLEPPFWVKPVLSFSSYMAFLVEDAQDFRLSAEALKKGASRFGRPFLDMMNHLHRRPESKFRNPNLCLAEAPLRGQQCTVEGYCLGGKVESHGIVDTHWFDDDSEPSRYQYPSSLPSDAQEETIELSRRVLKGIGYDNAGYNIEYYYDKENDDLGLLEINSRVSQSHSHIFEAVDGKSNHEPVLSVAEGRWPDMPKRKGEHHVAAKFFVRRFRDKDAVVKRIPTKEEIAQIEREFPGTVVQLGITEGMRLSDVLDQDTYSQRLAMVHTGAEDEKRLLEKFLRIQKRLDFDMAPLQTSALPAP